jgi:hypothetical protein
LGQENGANGCTGHREGSCDYPEDRERERKGQHAEQNGHRQKRCSKGPSPHYRRLSAHVADSHRHDGTCQRRDRAFLTVSRDVASDVPNFGASGPAPAVRVRNLNRSTAAGNHLTLAGHDIAVLIQKDGWIQTHAPTGRPSKWSFRVAQPGTHAAVF